MARRKKQVEEVMEEEVAMEVEEEVVEMEPEMEEVIEEAIIEEPIEECNKDVVDTGMVKVLVLANVKYKGVAYKRLEQLEMPAEEAKASKWCTVL